MHFWILKHKGADYWGNYMHSYEITFNDNEKVWADLIFYRRKDAQKYLKSKEYGQYYEVMKLKSQPRHAKSKPSGKRKK